MRHLALADSNFQKSAVLHLSAAVVKVWKMAENRCDFYIAKVLSNETIWKKSARRVLFIISGETSDEEQKVYLPLVVRKLYSFDNLKMRAVIHYSSLTSCFCGMSDSGIHARVSNILLFSSTSANRCIFGAFSIVSRRSLFCSITLFNSFISFSFERDLSVASEMIFLFSSRSAQTKAASSNFWERGPELFFPFYLLH